MHRPGLYFPYIQVRDDEWLKVAALYWPSVRRLVPDGYVPRDSPTARALADAGILVDERPRELVSTLAWEFVEVLEADADRLRHHSGLDRARREWDGRPWSDGSPAAATAPHLGWIHVDKVPRDSVERLAELGLAQVPDTGDPDDPPEWIGFHPALASVLMRSVAVRVSERSHFLPVTDQADLAAAVPAPDLAPAVNLLLGPHGPRPAASAGTATYVLLALQYARPRRVERLSVADVIACRRRLEGELVAFRRYVHAQQAQLAELAGVAGERRRLEAFADHVRHTIEVPLRDLERGLRLHRLDPTRSLVLASSVVPPVAVGAALDVVGAGPAVVTTAATAVAAGNAWWQVNRLRESMRASSPVGYLLDVRDRLTRRSLRSRLRRFVMGTAA